MSQNMLNIAMFKMKYLNYENFKLNSYGWFVVIYTFKILQEYLAKPM